MQILYCVLYGTGLLDRLKQCIMTVAQSSW